MVCVSSLPVCTPSRRTWRLAYRSLFFISRCVLLPFPRRPSDYDLLQFTPSEVGTACFMLAARHYCGKEWTVALLEGLKLLQPPSPTLISYLAPFFCASVALGPCASPSSVSAL